MTSLVAQKVRHLPTVFDLWAGKILWRRKWQPNSSTLAWKIPWTEEHGRLYSPWGRKESDTTERLNSLHYILKIPLYVILQGFWKVRHVEACPGKTPQTSSGAWLNFRGPTPCSLVQAGTDPEPLGTTRRCSPRFLPYMGRPGLDPGPGYNTSPHPSYLTDSLCLLTHSPPGVLPESKRPIKAFSNGP